MKKLNIFISYSHKDEAFKEALDMHLTSLKRSEKIATWNDRGIVASEEWDDVIKTQLEQADIVLLLISAAFMASDYIWKEELARAMHRHEAKTAAVVPVFILPCDWKGTPFERLQGLPRDARPVGRADNDQAWADIAKGIRTLVDKMAEQNRTETPIPTPVMREIKTQDILSWTADSCLRPTCTKAVLNELIVRRQSVNLTGNDGQGKSRLLRDLRDMASANGLSTALLNLKEHRLQYDNFLRSAAMQLALERHDYQRFEDLCDALSRLRDRRLVLLIDNLETLNEYHSNDPRYDARFVSGLNLLKDLPQVHLLCASREWLKAVVFKGETSLLNLHRIEISMISQQEIQAELMRRLAPHPCLAEEAKLMEARMLILSDTRPHSLLETLIARLQTQDYVQGYFDHLLTEIRHGK